MLVDFQVRLAVVAYVYKRLAPPPRALELFGFGG